MTTRITVDSHTDRQALVNEAAMQQKMLSNLSIWLKVLIAVSGIGVVFVWWGLQGTQANYPAVVGGGALALLGLLGVTLVQRGIVNGRKNVSRIIKLADELKNK